MTILSLRILQKPLRSTNFNNLSCAVSTLLGVEWRRPLEYSVEYSAGIFLTSLRILLLQASTVGGLLACILSLSYPQRKKSRGLRSDE